MSAEGEELVRAIAERFPGLRPLLDGHARDNDAILPHVFFGDLSRYVVSLFAAAQITDRPAVREELTGILTFLEQVYAANRGDHRELISVSFLENLPFPGDPNSGIVRMLGPNLSRQLKVIVDWQPDSNNRK